jgi:hypothetical protein
LCWFYGIGVLSMLFQPSTFIRTMPLPTKVAPIVQPWDFEG